MKFTPFIASLCSHEKRSRFFDGVTCVYEATLVGRLEKGRLSHTCVYPEISRNLFTRNREKSFCKYLIAVYSRKLDTFARDMNNIVNFFRQSRN